MNLSKIIQKIALAYDLSSMSQAARHYAQLDIAYSQFNNHYHMPNKTIPKIATAFQAVSPIRPTFFNQAPQQEVADIESTKTNTLS